MRLKLNSLRTLLLLAGTAALGVGHADGAVRYVKFNAVGANNGTSWANAHRKLQDALAAVVDGDEVWVAAGTYVPAVPADADPRDQAFKVRRGAKVYGGFLGNEATRSQRNPAVHVTILSGDINGDDLPGFINRADNSIRIVEITNEAPNPVITNFRVVDGFTIRGGNGSDPDTGAAETGAGMRVSSVDLSLRITNCVFRDNDGERAAALSISNVSPQSVLVTNCLFAGNRSLISPVEVQLSEGVRFASCTFAHNQGLTSNSPAFFLLNAPASVLTNCIFWGSQGGQATNAQSSQIQVSNSPGTQILSCVLPAGSLAVGAGCRFTDPCFVDPFGADGSVGTADDNFRLNSGSLAIDAGNGGLIPNDFGDTDGDGNIFEQVQVDLDRIPRVIDDGGMANTGVDPAVDIGAYENPGFSCLGDYTGDGLVNTTDLTRLLANFGGTSSPCGSIDLNGDGLINTADLVILLSKFGNNCNI